MTCQQEHCTYILPGQLTFLHNVSLRRIKINPAHFNATVLGLRHEVGNWIADGELNYEVGIVGELLHFGRHGEAVINCTGAPFEMEYD